MKGKLEYKILGAGIVILVISVVFINIFVLRMEKADIQKLTRERLEATAKIITKAIERTMIEGKADVTKSFVSDLKDVSGYDDIMVYNSDGRVAFAPNGPDEEKDSMRKIIAMDTHIVKEEKQSLIYFLPLLNQPQCRACHSTDGHILGAVKISMSLKKEYEKLTGFMMVMTVWSLIGLVILMFIFRQFLRKFVIVPVQKLESSAVKMAAGDMSFVTDIASSDEIGRLDNAIKSSLVSIGGILRRIREISRRITDTVDDVEKKSSDVVKGTQLESEAVSEISSSIEQLNSAIAEIADSTDGLTGSVDNTAASIEEMTATIGSLTKVTHELSEGVEATSSSIEELSATIKQVADSASELAMVSDETLSAVDEIISSVKEVERSAKEAAQISERVKEDANTLGVSAINKTIDGMENIRKSVNKTMQVIERLVTRSEEIGNILNVIDEITDQTALLALNAAILAAQAGEHGKGFSVVANEIKDLAERTAYSTKEIDQLITTVRQEVLDAVTAMEEGMISVEEGLKLSREASVSLRKMLDSATKSSEMSQSIERTTAEQAKTAKYVSESVERVRGMVGQIARATSEQSKGVTLIIDAAERIKDASQQVDKAVENQAAGSRQIANSIEIISENSQQISKAIKEQKVGATQIWNSLEKIKDLPSRNRGLAFYINRELRSLVKDAELITMEMELFKLRDEKKGEVIRFGVVPIFSPAELFRNFSPLISYLTKELGKTFELRVAKDFDTAIEEIRRGITQLCFMTSSTYIKASKTAHVSPLVTVLRKGKPFNRSVIITRDDSKIVSLSDLKKKSFAFVDRNSTSGYIVPRAVLQEDGVELEDLAYYDFLGHHDEVVKSVIKGDFSAGGIVESAARMFVDKGIRVVKYSPEIPEFNICAGDIEQEFKESVKHALLNLTQTNPQTISILNPIDKEYTGFTETVETDYSAIRAMMSKQGII